MFICLNSLSKALSFLSLSKSSMHENNMTSVFSLFIFLPVRVFRCCHHSYRGISAVGVTCCIFAHCRTKLQRMLTATATCLLPVG
jgi:hypothetical protein